MNIEELCRACLLNDRTMLSLVESIKPKFDSPSSSVVDLWRIFNKLLISDEVIFNICTECHDEIQRTYSFIQKCERSEDIMKKIETVRISLKEVETVSALHEDDSPEKFKITRDIYSNLPQSKNENIDWTDCSSNGYDKENTDSGPFDRIIHANDDNLVDLPSQSDNVNLEIERLDYLNSENDVTNSEFLIITQENEHLSTETDEFKEIESKNKSSTEIFICLGLDCSFRSRIMKSLEQHIIQSHIDGQICKLCNKEFICPPIDHCATHLAVGSTTGNPDPTHKKQYICKVCLKTFAMQCRLTEHLKIHTGERPFMCEICSKVFRRKSDLMHHFKSHTNERPYKCEICLKEFRQKIHLTQHLRSHTGERPFQCEICQKSFQQKKDLTRHLGSHTGERLFKCEICMKTFRQKIHLTQHLSCHTGERPFQCEFCSKTFRRRNDITRHLICHTRKRIFECEICAKTFQRQNFLTQHLRFHVDARPFKCESCPKTFRIKSDLKRHLSCHSDERPFKCESCPKAFRRKKNLTSHLKCHTTE